MPEESDNKIVKFVSTHLEMRGALIFPIHFIMFQRKYNKNIYIFKGIIKLEIVIRTLFRKY